MGQENIKKKEKRILKRSQKRLIFYILMVAVPSLQFLIFGAYVKLNSIILAFETYTQNLQGTGYIVGFAGLKNFEVAWGEFIRGFDKLRNSLILYACNLVIVMGLALIFSYYIAKKFPCSKYFRIMLYVPHIISSAVFVMLYKLITFDVYAAFMKQVMGVTDVVMESPYMTAGEAGASLQFNLILFFCLWYGFGSNVMLFTGSMSGINEAVIEAGKIDGCNVVQEFIYITIPSVWPTFVTFVITGIVGIFTNQMNLHAFFNKTPSGTSTGGSNAFDVWGYFLYSEAARSNFVPEGSALTYGELSALGLIFTVILMPITLCVKHCLEKYGPSVD